MTLKEAADALGMPKQTVRNWYVKLPEELKSESVSSGGKISFIVTESAFEELKKRVSSNDRLFQSIDPTEEKRIDKSFQQKNDIDPNNDTEPEEKDALRVQLQDRIDSLTATIKDRDDEIIRLKDQLDNLRKNVDDLNSSATKYADEISFLRGQISVKDKQIEDLSRAVNQEQQLNAMTISRIPARKTIGEWFRNLLPKHDDQQNS